MLTNTQLRYAVSGLTVLTVAYFLYRHLASKNRQGFSRSPVAPYIALHPENKTRRLV